MRSIAIGTNEVGLLLSTCHPLRGFFSADARVLPERLYLIETSARHGASAAFGMKGVIDTGFDPKLKIRDVLYTPDFYMGVYDYASMDIHYVRDSAYISQGDSIVLKTYLYEASSGSLIGTVGEYPIWWNTPDTTITVGFEVPYAYTPGTTVYAAVDVFERDLDHLDRRLSVLINAENGYGTPKRSAESGKPIANAADTPALSNYPNPFGSNSQAGSGTTHIRYQLDTEQHVQIAVYDLLGNKVAELVDGVRSAGSHTVPFSSGSLRSGTYFCRMTTSTAVTNEKMHIIN